MENKKALNISPNAKEMKNRFRGYLPVVVDVETAGFDAKKDALLEIAAVLIRMNKEGIFYCEKTLHTHVEPFPGANLDEEALAFNGINPYHPFRMAKSEKDALGEIFSPIRHAVKEQGCTRAILVGHNATFDLGFMNAAAERTGIKRNPFHPFSTFDTVSLCGLAYGQTVLARAAEASGVDFKQSEAHSAKYDAEKTAEIFCNILNQWRGFLNP